MSAFRKLGRFLTGSDGLTVVSWTALGLLAVLVSLTVLTWVGQLTAGGPPVSP
jgi:hypothetical protein